MWKALNPVRRPRKLTLISPVQKTVAEFAKTGGTTNALEDMRSDYVAEESIDDAVWHQFLNKKTMIVRLSVVCAWTTGNFVQEDM